MTNRFYCKQAFSLIELSIGMAVLAILASSIIPIGIRSLEIKAGEKTAFEIAMIQDASLNYYMDQHSWPDDIATLQSQGYLNAAWDANNPWHQSYQISKDPILAVINEVPTTWSRLVMSHLPGSSSDTSKVDATFSVVSAPISSVEKLNSLPTGTIIPWASSTLPAGFLWCNGQTVNVADYPNLAAIINNSYGGDGINTFTLPDMRGRTIVGIDKMGGSSAANRISKWGNFPSTLGGTFGEDAHALTIEEMPPHHHIAGPHLGDVPNAFGTSGVMRWRIDSPGTGVSSDAGGDHSGYSDSKVMAHNIVQPSIALGYVIKY